MLESAPAVFPFSAIVGQEEMKLALLAAAVDSTIGGVLVFGDRGTGKSTALRGLAALLPAMKVVVGCRYGCDPEKLVALCSECRERSAAGPLKSRVAPVPVVDMPLGVTEDRVVGALDLERALAHGERAFEPGLLARANRGFLYIDEVNLLEDHLVDLLIDVSASGENLVERDGLTELEQRVEVIKRRDEFERDKMAFIAHWKRHDDALRRRILAGRKRLAGIETPQIVLETAARLCMLLGTDGLRAELTLIRAARSLASFEQAAQVDVSHLRRVAASSLRHRLRRDPLDESGSTARVERAVTEIFDA